MSGPVPKPAATRRRVNKVASRASLREAPEAARPKRRPQLPRGRKWHTMTVAWWKDIWASPMAPEFLKADVHGLYLLAELVDRFWENPTVTMAAEIRHHRMAFGLTPIDRRRLQWEVERVETAARKKPPTRPQVGDDPRERLRMVK